MTDPRYIGTILYVGLAIFAALLAAAAHFRAVQPPAAGLTYAFCKKNHKMERAFVNEQCFFGFFREISCLGP